MLYQCPLVFCLHRFSPSFPSTPLTSLRVNLDMGKMVYSWMIQRDKAIPDTVVRSSTIPEELGRIEYLLSDKTGTLTQNEMVLASWPHMAHCLTSLCAHTQIFRKLHLGSVAFSQESMPEVLIIVFAVIIVAS